jgi:hypothetical protein
MVLNDWFTMAIVTKKKAEATSGQVMHEKKKNRVDDQTF